MQITLLGSGNIATILGKLCQRFGHSIVQVYGRNVETTTSLAETLCVHPVFSWHEITQTADIFIAALPDSFLPQLHFHLSINKGIIVHTSGAVPMSALKEVSLNFGIIYPLQSLHAKEPPPSTIPFLVDGNTPENKTLLFDFARTLSPVVSVANDINRLNLHLAAVWVNNFTNYLFTEAWNICKEKGLDFNMLLPLIQHTIKRLQNYPPAEMQTGPAIRGDVSTINKHLELLENRPHSAMIYKVISDAISKYYHDFPS